MTVVGWIVLSIGLVALAIFLLWLILERLYKRSSKETAFVRTGFGGQKVVMNGGALVLPVLHEVIPVNMNTLRLGVTRANNQALITRDCMRVDVQAEFYVRVKPTPEAIADAAQTLGRRTMDPEALKALVEGKFVDVLRAVAAVMSMEEIHQQRIEFVKKVQAAVSGDLLKNGLELESVSLTELDQTDQKYFNPQNAFDARGLTALTEEIQTRKKLRNVIERDTEVAIQRKNLEAERQKLNLTKEEEFARLEQQLEIEVRRAEQQAKILREQAEKEQEAKDAQIAARQRLDRAQIQAEQAVEEERLARELLLREKDIAKNKALAAAEIERESLIQEAQIKAKQKLDQAQLLAERALEEERIARDLYLKEKDLDRAKVIETAETEKDRIIREAQIAAQQVLDQVQVTAERTIEEARLNRDIFLQEKEVIRRRILELAEIERQKAVLLAEQDRAIALVEKSREHAAAQIEAEKTRLLAVRAEEQAITARQVEIAERNKAIELLEARKKAEREALAVVIAAEARKRAAFEQAEADKTISNREAEKLQIAAQAEAEAEMVRTEAAKKRYSVEAAGTRALHEAENVLSPDVIAMKVKLETIKHLGEIIRESVKPLEAIEGIKILHVDGLNLGPWTAPGAPAGAAPPPGGGGNLAEQLVNSALRYRGQAPLVDAVLKEIGLKGADLQGLTATLQPETERPPAPEEK
ncbi:MAG: flotillin domain-containing protein [Thermodesulfobacteriota bacterium]